MRDFIKRATISFGVLTAFAIVIGGFVSRYGLLNQYYSVSPIILTSALLAALFMGRTWDRRAVFLIGAPQMLLVIGLADQSVNAFYSAAYISYKSILIAIPAAAAIAFLFHKYKKFIQYPIFIWSACLLTLLCYIATLVFAKINGSKDAVNNWIVLFSMTFQPSEAAKFLYIIGLSGILNFPSVRLDDVKKYTAAVTFTALCCILLIFQGELGSVLIMVFTFFILTFIWIQKSRLVLKMSLSVILLAGAACFFMYAVIQISGSGFLIGQFDKVINRVYLVFHYADAITPEMPVKYRNLLQGNQLLQGMRAVANGGLFGANNDSFVHIPYANTDFVFDLHLQIFGLITGLLLFFIPFAAFFTAAFQCVNRTLDPLDKTIAYGFCISLFAQTLIMAAGNLAILPLTGNTIPFLSYGGSSLLVSFAMAGVLYSVNISYKG